MVDDLDASRTHATEGLIPARKFTVQPPRLLAMKSWGCLGSLTSLIHPACSGNIGGRCDAQLQD